MPDGPDEHDLLGFKDVKAQHPKVYIRKLCLAAENDRIPYPKFCDNLVSELAKCTNEVVNKYVKDDEKRHKGLADDACGFLKKEAEHLLRDKEYGPEIWGRSGSSLKSASNTPLPRWGAMTDSEEYEVNDEEEIILNLRYWMASRIQKMINTPCKDSQDVKKRAKRATKTRLGPRQKRKAHEPPGGSPDIPSDTAVYSDSQEQNSVAAAAFMGEESHVMMNGSGHEANSDGGARGSWPFSEFTDEESQNSEPPKKRKRTVRSWWGRDAENSTTVQEIGSSISSQPTPESANSMSLLRNMPTVTTPSTHERDIEHSILPKAKQELQRHLTSFLTSKKLQYHDVLEKVIPSARKLYDLSPQRKPHHDSYILFRRLSRTLDHWETFITRFGNSAGAKRSTFDDPFDLSLQKTLQDQLVAHRQAESRPESYMTLDTWAHDLATFLVALLGVEYMPFEDLVNGLSIANQPLCNSFMITSEKRRE